METPSNIVPGALVTVDGPLIYFDDASALGCQAGIVQITLEATVIVPVPGDTQRVRADRVVTAHLRCSPNAAMSLRAALESALLLAAPSAASA